MVAAFAFAFVIPGAAAAPQPASSAPGASDERLRQIMQQVQPQPGANQAGRSALREAASVSPERLALRLSLIAQGEAALAQLEVGPAMEAFDRAALILHAADTEMSLVRTYMQGGEYRRALAFGAHTAGAHLDVVGGAALYAWLLHLGGQSAIAQKLLTEALARSPGQPMAAAVQQQLQSGAPQASGVLLGLPARLAPYADTKGLPVKAQVIGTGVLLADGRQALVPLALLPSNKRSAASALLWLRNGLGQLSQAVVGQRFPALGVAVLELKKPLPPPETLASAPADPFPGSVGYAVAYVVPAAPDGRAPALPAWPLLRPGFMGGMVQPHEKRLLGIDMPAGPLGGPVFDAAGRLSGISLASTQSRANASASPEMVPASQLRSALGKAWPAPPALAADSRLLMDSMYESSLRLALQVIAVP